ncbi:MAG: PaaI family thioesterase [Syntrophales bacterium]|nr:PaaI family thioesterase [Syntrophales bacterium]
MRGRKLEKVTLDNGMEFTWDAFVAGTFIEANGIYLTDIGKGYAEGELPLRKELLNPAGILHGGVMATLADTVAIMGCGYLYEALEITTVNLQMSFLKAVRSGLLKARARVLSQGKNISHWQVEEYDEKGELVAVVTVTFAVKK